MSCEAGKRIVSANIAWEFPDTEAHTRDPGWPRKIRFPASTRSVRGSRLVLQVLNIDRLTTG
jgi:hypothetical protein